MFPIVPSHMLASSRQRSGTGLPNTSDRPIWNIWSQTECKSKDLFKIQKKLSKSVVTPCVPANSVSEDGYFAATFIPKDTLSKSTRGFPVIDARKTNNQISISAEGLMYCPGSNEHISENIWIKQLRFSMDVHSNNTILEMCPDNELRIRALRKIDINEELLVWFSEEILALMQIPFLTPANIRGMYSKSTKCITVLKAFEFYFFFV